MKPLLTAAILLLGATQAQAQSCGGSFSSFLKGVKSEAVSNGTAAGTVDKFLANARIDQKVLKADRSQGVFKLNFTQFAQRVISASRLSKGKANRKKYNKTLTKVQNTYGVDPAVMLAFWALETDYGAFQGNFNTLNALLTLSHDCRRPELFRPHIFAALELYKRGDFSPTKTTGAWAGEIGMVQMLPGDIITRGVDGDGDGQVSLKTSAPDALMSGANVIAGHGWRANEPWLVEITVPSDLDWSQTGLDKSMTVSEWAARGVKARGDMPNGALQASVLLPQGRKGPAFLALPNFKVYFEWNKSFVYVTTAAYFATRIAGAPRFIEGNPDPSLTDSQMKSLQRKLAARGYDVGKIDGILGARTRAAVQAEQARLGMPADAWPTKQLLQKL
ncbi:lytic murein transglycosylase [Amylibacter sp. IMCC11727]|uniref:lytic murein transglycosylase n=1 Tax=Amylibacter sp. IMCC11727 TaxID=3039851 RepID=UPI00244E3899|nr:lytic murein transglycosylase [Amylibacter sp. IMCC11727]WGI21423.1 lytic murein transglycosylase [Amylibacter sp. IMCC11727]